MDADSETRKEGGTGPQERESQGGKETRAHAAAVATERHDGECDICETAGHDAGDA